MGLICMRRFIAFVADRVFTGLALRVPRLPSSDGTIFAVEAEWRNSFSIRHPRTEKSASQPVISTFNAYA